MYLLCRNSEEVRGLGKVRNNWLERTTSPP